MTVMSAFVSILPVQTRTAAGFVRNREPCKIRTDSDLKKIIFTNRRIARCTATSPNDDARGLPRFRKDDDDPNNRPQTSFFPERSSENSEMATPNARILKQVQETMDRLGVSKTPPAPAPPRRPIDISGVNPASAFLGAAGAAICSYAAWYMLNSTIRFAVLHPMDEQIYIVQRVTTVIRTALVSLFALASGFSGVTSLGLTLLGLRTSYAAITGEFVKSSKSKPSPKPSKNEKD